MIVAFTAIEPSLEIREFSCCFPKLETALDLLSKIAEKGDKMLSVRIIDEDSQIHLPPDAFDGQPMAEAIQELEQEWQAVLQQPVRSTVLNQNLRIDLVRQQLGIYDRKINQLTEVINQFERLRRQTEDEFYYDSIKTKLTGHYDSLLATYRQYVVRAQASREAVRKKLSQLDYSYAG